MPRRRIIPSLVLSTILLAAAGPASVAAPSATLSRHHSVVRTDGRDTRGPLDLRSLRLVHLGPRFDRLWFSTWGPVTDQELNPSHDSDFAIGIDLNNVFPIHYEYWIYVDVVAGRLRAILVHPGSNRLVKTRVAHTGPSQFWVDIPLRRMGRPASYRFALYSYYPAKPCAPHHPCVDKLPNRLPLILQDLTPPTVTWLKSSHDSAAVSPDLTYPAKFTVRDDKRGSGVKRWAVQEQGFGSAKWTSIASGATAAPTVSVTGTQGHAYRLRVVATDRAGNSSISASKTIVFPFDDQNVAVAYAGTWTSATGSPTSFLGTTSSSVTLTDTATFSFTGGSQVCVLGMPAATGATAGVTIDAAGKADASEATSTPDRGELRCYLLTGGGGASHSLVLTLKAGPDAFVLDGFEVVP